MKNSSQTVFVGLSGGVDSAVTAMLLKEQGYRVVGAHMKNWSKDIGGFECPWEDDYQEAKRVAVYLGVEFVLLDFEQHYFDKVVQYMLDEFRIGRTPNPDVMCNQEIKFKLFLEAAVDRGADLIATGHYARTHDGKLLRAVDDNKDQTYFLYRVTKDALDKTLFPLGELEKPQVRALATQAGLPNANRKESMGICFVGKIGIKDFLSEYIDTESGDIVEKGQVVGRHDGAIFYTIGQRHGLGLGGGMPYYVTGKDMEKNEVYVTRDLADQSLWSEYIDLTSPHFIDSSYGPSSLEGVTLQVRTRHRADFVDCVVAAGSSETSPIRLNLSSEIKALTPGQSAVLYRADECIGGGIIA